MAYRIRPGTERRGNCERKLQDREPKGFLCPQASRRDALPPRSGVYSLFDDHEHAEVQVLGFLEGRVGFAVEPSHEPL